MGIAKRGAPFAASIAAIISLFSSLFSLSSYYVCPEWRKKLFSLEPIYFSLSLSNLFALQDFFFHPTSRNDVCAYQATALQFFRVCTWFYECTLAIESTCLVFWLKKNHTGLPQTKSFLSPFTRNIVYQIITLLSAISTSAYLLITSDYDYLNGRCWFRNSSTRLYLGYVIIWWNMVVIVLCNLFVFYVVYQSIHDPNTASPSPSSSFAIETITSKITSAVTSVTSLSNSSSPIVTDTSLGDPSNTTQTANHTASTAKMNKKVYLNRQIIIRYAIGPLLMVLLHIPGFILRVTKANSLSPSVTSFLTYADMICDPIHATVNAIVWVLADRTARTEWCDFLARLFGNRAEKNKSTEDILPSPPVEQILSSDDPPRLTQVMEISDDPNQSSSAMTTESLTFNPLYFLTGRPRSVRSKKSLSNTSSSNMERSTLDNDVQRKSSRLTRLFSFGDVIHESEENEDLNRASKMSAVSGGVM